MNILNRKRFTLNRNPRLLSLFHYLVYKRFVFFFNYFEFFKAKTSTEESIKLENSLVLHQSKFVPSKRKKPLYQRQTIISISNARKTRSRSPKTIFQGFPQKPCNQNTKKKASRFSSIQTKPLKTYQHINQDNLKKPARSPQKENKLISILNKINKSIGSNITYELYQIAKKIKHSSTQNQPFSKQTFQQARNSDSLLEKSNFIYQYVKHKKKYSLRDTQLFSFLISIQSKESPGHMKKLLQINTGEGKTLIAQCIALYFVLSGHKVDIVTSTEVLVQQNSADAKEFFSDLDIKIDSLDSQKQMNRISRKKECYQADILYGTCHQFCVDILMEPNKLEPIRLVDGKSRQRDFSVVIIDEVDNMLIDSFSNMTIISESLGYDIKVELAKEIIWSTVIRKGIERYCKVNII